MSWRDVVKKASREERKMKSQEQMKNDKIDILEGLSVLQENITPNMFVGDISINRDEGVMQGEFDNKKIDGFRFGIFEAKSDEYRYLGYSQDEYKEALFSNIKKIKDSELIDWAKNDGNNGRVTYYYSTFQNRENGNKISISMRKIGE